MPNIADYSQTSGGSGGGETFLQRQKRLQSNQNPDSDGYQQGLGGGIAGGNGGGSDAGSIFKSAPGSPQPSHNQPTQQHTQAPGPMAYSSAVSADGKIAPAPPQSMLGTRADTPQLGPMVAGPNGQATHQPGLTGNVPFDAPNQPLPQPGNPTRLPGPIVNTTQAGVTGNIPLGDPNQPLPQPGVPKVMPGPMNNAGGGHDPHDPFAASGGGVQLPGGGWVPKNHPLAQQAAASQGGGQGGGQGQGGTSVPQSQFGSTGNGIAGAPQRTGAATLQASDLGHGDFSTYQGTQFTGANPEAYRADQLSKDPYATYQGQTFNAQVPDAYKAGQLDQNPFATYQGKGFDNIATPDAYRADKFSQFSGPSDNGIGDQQTALMKSILGNPTTMNDQAVGILQERQKASALDMAKQLKDQAAQQAASRGTLGGGEFDRLNGQIDASTLNSILSGNQNIALQKMQQDRADQLGALGASSDLLNSQFGRAQGAYQSTLAGQTAQAGANQMASDSALRQAGFNLTKGQAGADEQFRNYQSQFGAQQAGLQRQLAQEGLNKDSFQSGLQRSGMLLNQQQANADEGFKGYQSQFNAQSAANQRQIAQAGINQAAAQSGLQNAQFGLQKQGQQSDENFRAFQTKQQAEQNALQRAIAQFDVNKNAAAFNEGQYGTDLGAFLQGRGQDIQKSLGDAGIGVDNARLREQGREFNNSFGLDLQKFAESQRQYNGQMGFNYNQLGQQGQNSMMNWLQSLYGGM